MLCVSMPSFLLPTGPDVLILTGLALLGALSPALTFAALFQRKEWRLDRLREHLRHEGWIGQLWGKVRAVLLLAYLAAVGLFLLAVLAAPSEAHAFLARALYASVPLWLLLHVGLGGTQVTLRRQRMPDRTRKAQMIVGLSLVLTALASAFLSLSMLRTLALPLLPLLQPLFVLPAWLLLLPLDRFLKQRTFRRARWMREQLAHPMVIGIAGSVGKTTVKELLATVLADLHPLTTPDHVNTEMGVSQWLIREMQNEKCKMQNGCLLIVEMGAYRKGEIELLSSIVQPTIGVVTALGSDHLALFGSEEAIVEANGELIEALPADGHAFLYGDNPGTRSLAQKSPCPVTTAGIGSGNDVRAMDVRETGDGLQFHCTDATFCVSMHGIHSVGNALLAIAVARHLGIADDRIRELLAGYRPLPSTFSVRAERGVTLLDDTYNISPLSLRAAIDWAGTRSQRPRILLTSGLLETGPEEDRFHAELGALAHGKLERVIFTTERGRAAFAKGYGDTVERLTDATEPAPAGSALLCVGRMTPATMQSMLPTA